MRYLRVVSGRHSALGAVVCLAWVLMAVAGGGSGALAVAQASTGGPRSAVCRPATAGKAACLSIVDPPTVRVPSHQGLSPNVPVPSWALGKRAHFFESRGTRVSLHSPLTEQGIQSIEGAMGEPSYDLINRNLGRRCAGGYCPRPPLLYHEGKGVQHSPKVYVIFWGKNWEAAPGAELRTQLLKMYEGLSGSAWQGILTQYFDATGRVSSTLTVSSYIDTSVSAPTSVNDAKIRAEIAEALKAEANKSWKRELTSQFVVIPAPGSTYEKSFYESPSGEASFCGYHGVDASGSSYTFVSYPGEEPFKKGCISFDPKENVGHVTSMIASHEYAESATDPQVEPEFSKNAEWYTSNGYSSPTYAPLATANCPTEPGSRAFGTIIKANARSQIGNLHMFMRSLDPRQARHTKSR